MELTPRRSVRAAVVGAALLLAVVPPLVVASSARAAQAPIGLGTATSFAVLAATTVTNTGPSTVIGDLGLDPGTAVTGNPTVTGATHIHDAVAGQAQVDNGTAFDDAAGRGPTTAVSGDLVGRTLTAGVYKSTSSLGLTGTVTLDGEGDPQAVFIFQIASTLITGSVSRVALVNGVQACNVFWQVGSSATLGTGSHLKGTVLALTSIAAQTAATVEGRLLAQTGAVTLDSNTITRPGCSTPGPPPTETPVPGPTVSTAPTAVPTGSTPPEPVPTESVTPTPVPTVSTPGTPSPSVLPTVVTSPTSPTGGELPATGPRAPVGPLAALATAAMLLGMLLIAGSRLRTRR
jgi:hypothetical protein